MQSKEEKVMKTSTVKEKRIKWLNEIIPLSEQVISDMEESPNLCFYDNLKIENIKYEVEFHKSELKMLTLPKEVVEIVNLLCELDEIMLPKGFGAYLDITRVKEALNIIKEAIDHDL